MREVLHGFLMRNEAGHIGPALRMVSLRRATSGPPYFDFDFDPFDFRRAAQ